MRYLRHDTRQNYRNATGTSDSNYLTDLVTSDISDVILKERPLLITGIKNAGIRVDPNVKDTELIRTIVTNAPSNNKLKQNLARLISYRHDKTQSKTYSAVGADPVSAVSNAVNSVFGFFEQRQEAKNISAENDQKLMDLIAAKMNSAKQTVTDNKVPIIIGGLVFIAAIGGLIYYLKK